MNKAIPNVFAGETGEQPASQLDQNFNLMPPAVVNIAALRLLTTMTATQVYVTGYYVANDGGQGIFVYDAADTTSPDNFGTIIVDASGHRWKRALQGDLTLWMFGARGDGVSDDTSQLQRAINAVDADTTAALVVIPPANFALYATVTIPAGVALQGAGVCDIDSPGTQGSYFYMKHTGVGFSLGDGVAINGVNFYWPDQVLTSPPIAYDYAIQYNTASENIQGVDISDIVMHNAYKAIDMAITGSGHTVGVTICQNLRLGCLNTGIHIADTSVSIFFSDIAFSESYWIASRGTECSGARRYMAENLVCIWMETGNGFEATDITFHRARSGLYINGGDFADPLVKFLRMTGCSWDGCRRCIEVVGPGALAAATITGCSLAAKDPDTGAPCNIHYDQCYAIYFNNPGQNVKMTVSGSYFAPSNGAHAWFRDTVSGVGGWAVFTGCIFEFANANSDVNPPYFNIHSTNDNLSLVVVGNSFRNNTNDVRCIGGQSVENLVVVGNEFLGPMQSAVQFVNVLGDLVLTGNYSADSSFSTPDVQITNPIGGQAYVAGNLWFRPSTAIYSTRPAFCATSAVASATSGTTALTIVFGTERFDRGSNYDNTTGIFTCPVSGQYEFNVTLTHDGTCTPADVFAVRFNSTNASYSSRYYVAAAVTNSIKLSSVVDMEYLDTCSVEVQRISGAGTLTLSGQSTQNYFSATIVE